MDDVKITLTIELPGAVMYQPQDCIKEVIKKVELKNGKTIKKHVLVDDFNKTESCHFKVNKEDFTIHTRKCIPARQSVNITNEAYIHYVDKSECPSFVKTPVWSKMSKRERLESHLNEIAISRGGRILTYCIHED